VSGELQATVEHPRREIEHGGGFGVGESDGAQVRVTRDGDAVGRHGSFAQVDHSLVNSVRRFGREQLIRDRASKVREPIGDGRTSTNRGRTNNLDEGLKRLVTVHDRARSISWCQGRSHSLTIADDYDITGEGNEDVRRVADGG
jgi:hypothetical protein